MAATAPSKTIAVMIPGAETSAKRSRIKMKLKTSKEIEKLNGKNRIFKSDLIVIKYNSAMR